MSLEIPPGFYTMVNLFERLPFLETLVKRQPMGLFTDFDGTISRIAPTPGEARISSVCRQRLTSLSAKLPLVAIV
ncbi:MAG: hypothetical protein ACE5KI_06980, partial [Dehalococcoidia bacterium]